MKKLLRFATFCDNISKFAGHMARHQPGVVGHEVARFVAHVPVSSSDDVFNDNARLVEAYFNRLAGKCAVMPLGVLPLRAFWKMTAATRIWKDCMGDSWTTARCVRCHWLAWEVKSVVCVQPSDCFCRRR
eukprot:6186885-Pleurochrysis_carterae.AAC.3